MTLKFFQKPEPDNSDRVPPGQYLAKGFPVLTYGDTPQISTDNWQFKVWGLVTEKTFSWSVYPIMNSLRISTVLLVGQN